MNHRLRGKLPRAYTRRDEGATIEDQRDRRLGHGIGRAALLALVALLMASCSDDAALPGDDPADDAGSSTDASEDGSADTEPSFVEVENPRRSEDDFHSGVAVLAYGNEGVRTFREKSAAALDRLAELQVNSVSLVFPLFQDDWRATEIGADPERTPSEENIEAFVEEAKRRGFTVLLRPTLDEESLTPDGEWRGSIEPADLDAWFSSYGRVMTIYGELAASADADVLAIGTELTSLHDERDRWRELIRDAREVFDGQITYATNWDAIAPAYVPSFIGALDFLSVDAFFPLEVADGADVGAIARGWRPWLRQLRNIGPPLEKIVFTEVGVRAQEGAYRKPYAWQHAGAASPQTQRRYYAATCESVAQRIGGLYWWVVDIHHPTEAELLEDFSPLGKPAEREIARCFQGLR